MDDAFERLSPAAQVQALRARIECLERLASEQEQILVLLSKVVAVWAEKTPGVLTDLSAALRSLLFERVQQGSKQAPP